MSALSGRFELATMQVASANPTWAAKAFSVAPPTRLSALWRARSRALRESRRRAGGWCWRDLRAAQERRTV